MAIEASKKFQHASGSLANCPVSMVPLHLSSTLLSRESPFRNVTQDTPSLSLVKKHFH